MEFDFIHINKCNKIVQYVLIDNRNTSLSGWINGNDIQKNINLEIKNIDKNTLFYKIEDINGILVGYFYIFVDKINITAVIKKIEIRRIFDTKKNEIIKKINGFVINKNWETDILFNS